MKRIIVTESQFNMLMESQMIVENFFDISSIEELKSEMKKFVRRMLMIGMSIGAIYSAINKYCDNHNVPENVKQEVMTMVNEIPEKPKVEKKQEEKVSDWVLVDNKTIATVYNAVPNQCNADFGHTASMFRLNLNDVLSQRIIAMERTYMSRLGLKYGDVVYIEGTGKYDGVWQIQDTMNKRYAGQRKIDILVPNNIKNGMWKNVKIYTLRDKSMTSTYKSQMAPQVSRAESKRQVELMRQKLNKKRG